MLMTRAFFIAAFFFTMSPLLISRQWLLTKLGLPGWGFIASNYYRALCALLCIHVRVTGAPMHDRAVLYVSNHVSRADIVVIGSVAPVAFVAKREVASWPLVGVTKNAADRVCRLYAPPSGPLGRSPTSSGGRRMASRWSFFRRHLKRRQPCSAIPPRAPWCGGRGVRPCLQHRYSADIPMGRQHRPLVAWYGDLDFLPHIKAFIEKGAVDAVVSYGNAVPADVEIDRKTMTRRLESSVRGMLASALRGRPLAVQNAHSG
jgi:hypothetical protein